MSLVSEELKQIKTLILKTKMTRKKRKLEWICQKTSQWK